MPRTKKPTKTRRIKKEAPKPPPLPEELVDLRSPIGYQPHYAKQAFLACAEGGLSEDALGRLFGVAPGTVDQWQQDEPLFRLACEAGLDYFNAHRVEKALLSRALGFDYEEVSTTVEADGGISVRKVSKKVLPDVKACIYWLQNRSPKRWQNIRHELQSILDMQTPEDRMFGEAKKVQAIPEGLDQEQAAGVYLELVHGTRDGFEDVAEEP